MSARPLITVWVDRPRLLTLLGAPLEANLHPYDGLPITADLWKLILPCGLALTILHGRDTSISDSRPCAEIHGADAPLHALLHLGLDPFPFEPSGPWPAPHFRVLRQDDHGHTFPVADTPTEHSADCIATLFTLRGHKQLYTVEPLV